MSQIKAYSGSAFVSATPKVWNGTSWVEPVTKYWNGTSWVTLTNVPLVPAGLIVPLNAATAPSGWSRFTVADDKFIVGAGSTYTVAATGGQTQAIVSTDTEADHTGTTTAILTSISTGTATGYLPVDVGGGGSAAGSHSHTETVNFTPAKQSILLIKADADANEFPANAIVLTKANSNPGALTSCYTTNTYLCSAAAISADAQVLAHSSMTSNGSHNHTNGYTTRNDMLAGSYYLIYPGNKGSHSHGMSTLSLNADAIKKAYLMAWTKTAAFTDASGVIAMWEGSTAPDGWALCDGTGGTLDLRDYFIKLSDSINVGTVSGDNTVDINGTTAADGAHEHRYTSSALRAGSTNGVYHGTNSDHTHDLTGSSSYVPEYYALTFVTYTG